MTITTLADHNLRIGAIRITERPRWGMTSMGYTLTSGAPTSRMVQLVCAGHGPERRNSWRWRRVMVACTSNAGTMFIPHDGGWIVVRESDLQVDSRAYLYKEAIRMEAQRLRGLNDARLYAGEINGTEHAATWQAIDSEALSEIDKAHEKFA